MTDLDYDKMSDEDFEDLLDNIDDVDTADATDTDEDNFEDTDQTEADSDSDEEETDTNEEDDDFLDDTDDDSEEEDDDRDEENTHAEEEDDDDDSSDSKEVEADEAGSKDDSEPEEGESADIKDPDDMTTEDKTDYKKAYEEALAEKAQYEDFYNQTTGEFIANGKTMRAPTDPKKIIQALQKAVGFDDKMKAFKKYRPFTTTLEEKGFLDNPDKFNLMVNAMDGDKEAIKKLISNAEIDPIELDMDNIDYKSKSVLPTNMEIAYEDVMDSAKQYGVKEQVDKVINGDWDDESVIELLNDPKNSADLVKHLSTGVYDMVQDRIAQKRMVDSDGTYSSKKAIEQYRDAAKELDAEYKIYLKQQSAQAQNESADESSADNGYGSEEVQFSEEEIQAEIERIKEEKVYSQKVKKRNAEAEAGRKKAASLSKKKPRSKKKSNDFDPGKLSDDEFTAYLDGMIYD